MEKIAAMYTWSGNEGKPLMKEENKMTIISSIKKIILFPLIDTGWSLSTH